MKDRRSEAEALGHDFTDWQNNPIEHCNFCHVDLNSPKALEQCDISDKLKLRPFSEVVNERKQK